MSDKWVLWAEKLTAYAQNDIAYSDNPYDIERYESIREIAGNIIAEHTPFTSQEVVDLFAREKFYRTAKLDVRGAVFKRMFDHYNDLSLATDYD